MPSQIFDFVWFRNIEGYHIVETDPSVSSGNQAEQEKRNDSEAAITGARQLIAANIKPGKGLFNVDRYNPLRQHKCLFRALSEAGRDPDNILAFANSYGLMGFNLDSGEVGKSPLYENVEPLELWLEEIKSMQKTLFLWDMVESGDSRRLTEYLLPFIYWIEADMGLAESLVSSRDGKRAPDMDPEELRWFRTHPEIREWYRSGDLFVPALMRIQAVANKHLEKRISPRILWDDRRRKTWSIYFVPVNLIGAIWLQFSQSVTQEKDYRRCRQCEKWFEIDHYTARTNRYFCSNACRSKAYRLRQSKAKEMSAQGESLKSVAEQLGSDVETVKKWIEK